MSISKEQAEKLLELVRELRIVDTILAVRATDGALSDKVFGDLIENRTKAFQAWGEYVREIMG